MTACVAVVTNMVVQRWYTTRSPVLLASKEPMIAVVVGCCIGFAAHIFPHVLWGQSPWWVQVRGKKHKAPTMVGMPFRQVGFLGPNEVVICPRPLAYHSWAMAICHE